MIFTFSKIQEIHPKNTIRSNRLNKKLHIGKFKETMFYFSIDVPLFNIEQSVRNLCIDLVCEYDNACFISTNNSKTCFTIIADTIKSHNMTDDELQDVIKNYINELVLRLSTIKTEFKKIKTVQVEYGDAYYGEWECLM